METATHTTQHNIEKASNLEIQSCKTMDDLNHAIERAIEDGTVSDDMLNDLVEVSLSNPTEQREVMNHWFKQAIEARIQLAQNNEATPEEVSRAEDIIYVAAYCGLSSKRVTVMGDRTVDGEVFKRIQINSIKRHAEKLDNPAQLQALQDICEIGYGKSPDEVIKAPLHERVVDSAKQAAHVSAEYLAKSTPRRTMATLALASAPVLIAAASPAEAADVPTPNSKPGESTDLEAMIDNGLVIIEVDSNERRADNVPAQRADSAKPVQEQEPKNNNPDAVEEAAGSDDQKQSTEALSRGGEKAADGDTQEVSNGAESVDDDASAGREHVAEPIVSSPRTDALAVHGDLGIVEIDTKAKSEPIYASPEEPEAAAPEADLGIVEIDTKAKSEPIYASPEELPETPQDDAYDADIVLIDKKVDEAPIEQEQQKTEKKDVGEKEAPKKQDKPAEKAPSKSEVDKDVEKARDTAFKNYIATLASQTDGAMDPNELYKLLNEAEKNNPHKVIDREFIMSISWQESRFDPRAVSPADAMGLTQFMPGTAAEWLNGDPFNPADSLDASFRYYAYIYDMMEDRFPNKSKADLIDLTLAGYNAGPWHPAILQGQVPNLAEPIGYIARIVPTLNEVNSLEKTAETKVRDAAEAQKKAAAKKKADAAKKAAEAKKKAEAAKKKAAEAAANERHEPVPEGSPVSDYYEGHAGIDYAVPIGTPTYAAVGGTVDVREYDVRGEEFCASALRNIGVDMSVLSDPMQKEIRITSKINGKTYLTLYAHMSDIDVKPGQKIEAGQLIGKTGNTGCSTGAHLHFEVQEDGTPIDPGVFLSKR